MELRVKEICKQKGLQLKDLAEKMGIAKESLSRAINGNPQLSTLEGITRALEVDIQDLFPQKKKSVYGYLEIDNVIYKVENMTQLKELMDRFKLDEE